MRRLKQCNGSVSVEFAAVLPLVAVALLLVAQIGLLVAQQLTVRHAAREGARNAAVTNDDASAHDAALRAGDLDEDRASVAIAPQSREVGDPVTVTVRYRPGLMPLVGTFLPDDFVLSASVTM